MVSRKIILIIVFIGGIVAFIVGVTSANFAIMMLGLVIAAIPGILFAIILSMVLKDRERQYGNTAKFRIIYRLLPKEFFHTFQLRVYGGVSNTKIAAMDAYRKEAKKKDIEIKHKKSLKYYTQEKVFALIKRFSFGHQSPQKIQEYFVAMRDSFPCNQDILHKSLADLNTEVEQSNKGIKILFQELITKFGLYEEKVRKQNDEILKNHKPTETTGLGFGVITNSAINMGVYAALDADERRWQELSNAPRLESTEEDDNKALQDAYDKIINLYKSFIDKVIQIFSNNELYIRNETQVLEDKTVSRKLIRKILLITTITCTIVAVCVSATFGGIAINKLNKYNKAIAFAEDMDYSKAISLLEEIPNYKDSNSLIQEYSIKGLSKLNLGEELFLGYYNGKVLKWNLIKIEKSKYLIICNTVIDELPYNPNAHIFGGYGSQCVNTWENSTLRTWLNDEFYKNAFEDIKEFGCTIPTVEVNNNEELKYTSFGGANTFDKVFILNYTEAHDYLFNDTLYYANGNIDYWLRSPSGTNGQYVRCIKYLSGKNDSELASKKLGVRPALYIEL